MSWCARLIVAVTVVIMMARQTGLAVAFLPTLVATLPLLVPLLALAVLFGVLAHHKIVTMLAAACAIVISVWWLPVFTPGPTSVLAASEQAAPGLRVLAFNAMASPAAASGVVAQVKQHHVDVLVLSECGPALRRILDVQGIRNVLPHRVGTTTVNGLVVWSSHPLTRREVVPLSYGGEVVDVADIGGDGRTTLRIFAAHPMSPRWNMGSVWAADQKEIVSIARDLPETALIVGDLNMTRDHLPFRKLQSLGFVDALDATASGWQPTWSLGAGNPGLATIDHVLGRGVGFDDYKTLTIQGSDHHAVLTTVTIPSAIG